MATHFRINIRLFWLVIAAWAAAGSAKGEEPKSGPPSTLNQLGQEVSALHILHQLNVTPAQLQQLRKWAKETQLKDGDTKPGKGSDKLRTVLVDIRQALLENKNPEQIDKLAEKLDALREEEKPDLDDEPDLTESARRRAPEALRILGASQVAVYLAGLAGDIRDPQVRLIEALDEVRKMTDVQWKEFRADFGDIIARQVVGVDAEKAEKISDQVLQLLLVARSLKDAEFKAQRSDLEKSAQKILGDAGPFQVLQNIMENVMAVLLSNPRLSAAIDARLEKK